MSVLLIDNCPIVYGGINLTADVNEFSIGEMEADVKDKTNMGSIGWQENIGGIARAKMHVMSFADTALLSTVSALQGQVGQTAVLTVVDSSVTTASNGGAASDPAFFTQTLCSKVDQPHKVGDIAMINTDFVSRGPEPLVSGSVLLPFSLYGTGANGTSVTLGAVATGHKAYAAFHVTGVAGSATPTMIARVESAPLSNFASPTTRMTFTNATATGSQMLSVAGPITDTFWRVVYSFTGTAPFFFAGIVAGIV